MLPFLLMILHFSQIFFTDGLTFILLYQPFLSLLCTPGNASLIEIVNRDLNGYAVTGQNSDIVHSQLSRNMRGHNVTVGQLDLEGGVRKCFQDNAVLKLDKIILRQKNPSYCNFTWEANSARIRLFVSDVSLASRISSSSFLDSLDGANVMPRPRPIMPILIGSIIFLL